MYLSSFIDLCAFLNSLNIKYEIEGNSAIIPDRNLRIMMNHVIGHPDKNHNQTIVKNSKYRVLQIWEDSWEVNDETIKRFLSNLLSLNVARIGARKTEVRPVDNDEFSTFLNENHLQGECVSSVRIGLYYNDELVSVMGFKKQASNTKPYAPGVGYELIRFANKNVSGAFSKLMKHFERLKFSNYVISFADLETVSAGKNVYSSNGFSFVKEIPPDYKYFNFRTHVREHKFKWRKSTFEKLGMDITGKTENDLYKEHKLIQCWDSGKILYIKTS